MSVTEDGVVGFFTVYLQDYVSRAVVAVLQVHAQADGDERATEGQDDRPEGHQVHHWSVYPRTTVNPQAQRHQHQRQDRGGNGHDDAGGKWEGVTYNFHSHIRSHSNKLQMCAEDDVLIRTESAQP